MDNYVEKLDLFMVRDEFSQWVQGESGKVGHA